MKSNCPHVKSIERQGGIQGGGEPDAARDRTDQIRDTAMGSDEKTTRIDRSEGDFVIDAILIGELLNIPPADVPALMRSKAITSVCETGIEADQGTFRLNLFHRGRHVRLRIDAEGRVLQRSAVDFGQRFLARGRRRKLTPPHQRPPGQEHLP